MAVVLEKERVPVDRSKCPHASVNRVLDTWTCNRCGAEFKPVHPEDKTKW